jgi:type IV pilus assembly protein PilN
MIKINLLAEGKRAAVRKTRSTVSVADREWGNWALLGGMVVGLLVAAGWWGILWSAQKEAERLVEEKQREVTRLEPILKEVEKFEKVQKDLETKIKVINDLKNAQTGPVRVMDAVSRALPELLWLDGMQVSANLIKLNGRAFNYAAISNFIENLDAVPEFKEPQLGRAAAAGAVNTFSITVAYSLAPPPPPAVEGATNPAVPGAPAGGASPAPAPVGPGR